MSSSLVVSRDRWIVALLLGLPTATFALYTVHQPLAWSHQLAAILTFSVFFSCYLLLGLPRLVDQLRAIFAARPAGIFGVAVGLLAAYGLYAFAVARWSWIAMGVGALYLCLPAALLTAVPPQGDGLTWQDALALVLLWGPLEWGGLPLASVPVDQGIALGKLLGLGWSLFLFLVVRRLDGVGYTFDLRLVDLQRAGVAFALFGVFCALPIAIPTHFAASAPAMKPGAEIGLTVLAIFFLVALPEELLFRGLLHTLLARRLRDHPHLALVSSSLLFGLAHAKGPEQPVWVYVVLATLAGGFYGWTFVTTGKVTAAAVTHWLVDSYWSILFQGSR
jgi:membrane protease YdiL (CAAX protease family)